MNQETSQLTLDMQALYDELFPLCRSLTGEGYDKSLAILQRYVPFKIEEYESGTQVCDWIVPPAWTLRRATLKDPNGKIILDTNDNVLHVLNYSDPFSGKVSLAELQEHLYSDPLTPKAIPYTTSYYKNRWGLCMSQEQRDTLVDGMYQVEIDTIKDPEGAVKIGVCDLIGQSNRIVQLSAYMCHPSLLNNELSGPITLVYLYQLLKALPNRKYTYRFVINPETIGSICYLSRHAKELKERLEYGIVLTCMAAPYNQQTLQKTKPHERKCKSVIDLSLVNKDYFALLEQFEVKHEQNFLPLPLSFKRTRQSFVDEMQAYFKLDPNQSLKSEGAATSDTKNPLDLQSRINSLAAGMKQDSGKLARHSYVLLEASDPTIDDADKMKRYRECELNFEKIGSNNFKAATTAVPEGKEHTFKYSYDIDNVLAQLAYSNSNAVSLRHFAANSGSDERQYCSALLNLPVVQVTRTLYACYPGYHTSEDNQELFSLDSLIDSALQLFTCIKYLECYKSKPKCKVICEPQLGRRGLYPDFNSPKVRSNRNTDDINSLEVLMGLLNLSDGTFDINQLSQMVQVSPLDLTILLEHLIKSEVITLTY